MTGDASVAQVGSVGFPDSILGPLGRLFTPFLGEHQWPGTKEAGLVDDGGPAIMEFSTFETAVEAYLRYCRRNGVIYQQSDEALSRVGRKSVSLETVRVDTIYQDIWDVAFEVDVSNSEDVKIVLSVNR